MEELCERMLGAWIEVNGMLKDSRITQGLTYNEAVVMKQVYDQYRSDGTGRVAVGQIARDTNMLKSLVNRTVGALCDRGYLLRERGERDGRNVFVRPVEARLEDFLAVHRRSLALVEQIIGVVGLEDARSFVRMAEKLSQAGLRL